MNLEVKEIGEDDELKEVDPEVQKQIIKQLKISYDELDSEEEEEESEDEETFNDYRANRLDSIIEEDDEDATEY